MNNYSYFLFARPSFLEGIARILDFGNTLNEYNQSNSPEQADTLAISADWRAIGSDIQAALAALDEDMAECMTDGEQT